MLRGFSGLREALVIAVVLLGAPAQGEVYQYYFGNTHSHTLYSDGGPSTPADHYSLAKSSGYDFYAVTDHALAKYTFTAATYAETQHQADTHTDGSFVGIAGFEFSENDGPNGTGHLNALNSVGYLDATGSSVNIPVFYDWLTSGQTTTVAASFNHPGATSYNSFGYLTPARRDAVTMFEIINSGNLHSSGYLAALAKGWRVAPVAAEDGHGTWRITNAFYRTGVLATSLTRENIMQAMRARRVYATFDKNLSLSFSANGRIMGTVLGGVSSLDIAITASDPDTGDANDKITKMELIGGNGVVVASKTFSAHTASWSLTANRQYNYYFVQVYSADKTDGPTAYSAPIWIDDSLVSPTAPSALTAAAASSRQIDLHWHDSANELGYKIERKTGSTGAWSQIGTAGADVVEYRDAWVAMGTTYSYRVRAYNDTGDSAYTNTASATTITAAAARSEGIRVVGNRLARDGQLFVPLGFTMVGLLSPTMTGTAGTAGLHYNQLEIDTARAWNANTLRFQVSQRGFDPTDSLYSAAYIQRVKDGVALARRNGFAVILSMQDQSLGGGDASDMPEPQTLRSWDEVTRVFNGDPNVMYEVWNEPMVKDTAAEWELWRNGGTLDGLTVVGHQQLVDRIRASGARNVLIAEGTRVGKSFIGCPGLNDSLRQLAYGIHPYLTSPILDPSSWDTYFGNWAQTYPVIATEWSAPSNSSFCQAEWPTLSPQLLSYLKTHGIGVMAWAFDITNTLIKDWNWTPTNFTGFTCGVSGCGPGELVKQHLASYVSAPSVNAMNLGYYLGITPDNAYASYFDLVVSQQISGPQVSIVYVQARNRTAALKAVLPEAMATQVLDAGALLSLSGRLGSEYEQVTPWASMTWGDRVLYVTGLFRSGTTAAPRPLFVRSSSAVGAWAADLRQGNYGSLGPNNLGLYASAAGRITYIAPGTGAGSISHFYVDDGCGLTDGTSHPDGTGHAVPNVGLRIVPPSWATDLPPFPGFAVGAEISVTGCTALELVGLGGLDGIPSIRIASMQRVIAR